MTKKEPRPLNSPSLSSPGAQPRPDPSRPRACRQTSDARRWGGEPSLSQPPTVRTRAPCPRSRACPATRGKHPVGGSFPCEIPWKTAGEAATRAGGVTCRRPPAPAAGHPPPPS
ncbi:hypothetical protein PVAP13_1KG246900 [Panicum virgatum]|uniref:Uncharacterized protein n=1 Tax=Panicum virgatum TaxID=38727 RepID=A0A8T0XK45_PANVG|nr:hypothetical protein PVAP13_1KG246900 [Panicum virgatum]